MKNYNFEDFTVENYKKILEFAKQHYKFYGYEDIPVFNNGVIWRHDIDYSVNRAYRLSEIEKGYDVKATYFVMLHSEFYNIFEKDIGKLLRGIVRNGGSIGLHFEPAYYDLTDKDILKMNDDIKREKELLETIIECPITSFSFHNPDVNGDFTNLEDEIIGGLINVYSKKIRTKFRYCSDSNGYWRFSRLEDFLKEQSGKENAKLHILTHPAWWQDTVMTPRERIVRCVEGRAKSVMKNYDSQLEKNNRENIF